MGARFGIIQMDRYTEQFSLIEFDQNSVGYTDDI